MHPSIARPLLSPALLLLACGQSEPAPPTGPRESPSATATIYVLRTVAGDPVPAVLVDTEHVTIVTLADTVWLEADGTGVQVSTERTTDKACGAPAVVRTDARLALDHTLYYRTPLEYERVR